MRSARRHRDLVRLLGCVAAAQVATLAAMSSHGMGIFDPYCDWSAVHDYYGESPSPEVVEAAAEAVGSIFSPEMANEKGLPYPFGWGGGSGIVICGTEPDGAHRFLTAEHVVEWWEDTDQNKGGSAGLFGAKVSMDYQTYEGYTPAHLPADRRFCEITDVLERGSEAPGWGKLDYAILALDCGDYQPECVNAAAGFIDEEEPIFLLHHPAKSDVTYYCGINHSYYLPFSAFLSLPKLVSTGWFSHFAPLVTENYNYYALFHYEADTLVGSSGAGVLVERDGEPVLVGLHTGYAGEKPTLKEGEYNRGVALSALCRVSPRIRGITTDADEDADQDGLSNCQDNCPHHPNADQADCDRDGIGDVCDDDICVDFCDDEVGYYLVSPNQTVLVGATPPKMKVSWCATGKTVSTGDEMVLLPYSDVQLRWCDCSEHPEPPEGMIVFNEPCSEPYSGNCRMNQPDEDAQIHFRHESWHMASWAPGTEEVKLSTPQSATLSNPYYPSTECYQDATWSFWGQDQDSTGWSTYHCGPGFDLPGPPGISTLDQALPHVRDARLALVAISPEHAAEAGSWAYGPGLVSADAAIAGLVHMVVDGRSLDVRALGYGTGTEPGSVPDTTAFAATRFALPAVDAFGVATAGAEAAPFALAAFGGESASGARSNRLWFGVFAGLDREGTPFFEWTDVTPQGGPLPPARSGALLLPDNRGGRLLLLGGVLESGAAATDLWEYDLERGAWSELGTALLGLAGGRFAMFGGRAYVVGEVAGEPGARILRLDTRVREPSFEEVGSLADGPGERQGAAVAFAATRSGRLLVYGGVDAGGAARSDLWEYDLGTRTWSRRLGDCEGRWCPAAGPGALLFANFQGRSAAVVSPRDVNLYYKATGDEGWKGGRELAGPPPAMDCDGDGVIEPEMKVEGRWAYLSGLVTRAVWDDPATGLVSKGTHDLRSWVGGRVLRDKRAERVRKLLGRYELWEVE